tara:strand:+ start:301 stop:939 length:639 start_codon:yes stop_codon:yes gene_type:complete
MRSLRESLKKNPKDSSFLKLFTYTPIMIALVGLGNPGKQYKYNRHNIGYLAIDEIVKSLDINNQKTKFNGKFYKSSIGQKSIILFKSNDYMNECGYSISQIISFFKLKKEDLYVFHDDLDLEIGKIRIKNGGSSAGHNGLKSIDKYIGKNYNRVRIGIGHPGEKKLVEKYVLSNFKEKEWSHLSIINQNISENINLLVNNKHSSFLNKIKLS